LPYSVDIDKDAAKYIKSLDAPTRARFKEKLEKIQEDPFDPTHSKHLKKREERSAQVGGYRILFEVDAESNSVHVVHAAPRGQVYKD
jgi:mRNA-degrading endonuclease RelE of RelBE toxin-antitoxin system